MINKYYFTTLSDIQLLNEKKQTILKNRQTNIHPTTLTNRRKIATEYDLKLFSNDFFKKQKNPIEKMLKHAKFHIQT